MKSNPEEGRKVIYKEEHGEMVISISGKVKQWQFVALSVWVVLWLACGVAVMFFLPDADKNMAVILVVYLAFWLYFLYKSTLSLLWRTYGIEYVKITPEELWYKRDMKGYGQVFKFDLATMQKVGTVDFSSRTFSKVYADAFWTIGGERVGFEYLGQKITLGRQVSEGEATKLAHVIQQASKNAKRNK